MILSAFDQRIAALAAQSPETGLENAGNAPGCLIPPEFIERLERRHLRKCAECGDEFEAVGLQGYCDTCSIRVDERAAAPPIRKLDSSWPRLHAGKLDAMTGPSRTMAEKLAPRLFGNLSLIHISEPTRPRFGSRMPSSA